MSARIATNTTYLLTGFVAILADIDFGEWI